MKREELVQKMLKCFNTCTFEMHYNVETAMDRVLEIIEEELEIDLNEDTDDDNYCGAV